MEKQNRIGLEEDIKNQYDYIEESEVTTGNMSCKIIATERQVKSLTETLEEFKNAKPENNRRITKCQA